jgi:hypothetical protein
VAPTGKYFAGINYGKISRSREVISYAGATDWTANGPANPETDGLFRVEIATGVKTLLISYRQLSDLLLDTKKNRRELGDPDKYPIYVHHTIWNRDSQWIAFIVRGKGDMRPNAGCAIRWDGTELTPIPYDGHPEWAAGSRLALPSKDNGFFSLYDVAEKKWAGRLWLPGVFPDTRNDNALSPDARWHVGSHRPTRSKCIYTIFRLSDGAYVRSPAIPTKAKGGVCRVDPAPRWNRTSDALLAPGLAADGTRQLFVLRLTIEGN